MVSVVPSVNDALSCSLQTCPPNFPKEEISLQEEYHCARFFQQFLTPFIQGRSLNDHTVSRFTDSKMERRWLLHRRCLEDASPTRGWKKRRTHSGRNQVDGHERGAALRRTTAREVDQVVSRVEIGPWPILHPRNALSNGTLTMRYVSSSLTIHEHPRREKISRQSVKINLDVVRS